MAILIVFLAPVRHLSGLRFCWQIPEHFLTFTFHQVRDAEDCFRFLFKLFLSILSYCILIPACCLNNLLPYPYRLWPRQRFLTTSSFVFALLTPYVFVFFVFSSFA